MERADACVIGPGIGREAETLALVAELAKLVAVPLYLVLMLGLYVVMYGFYYHAWRDIFGVPAAVADASATDAIVA